MRYDDITPTCRVQCNCMISQSEFQHYIQLTSHSLTLGVITVSTYQLYTLHQDMTLQGWY